MRQRLSGSSNVQTKLCSKLPTGVKECLLALEGADRGPGIGLAGIEQRVTELKGRFQSGEFTEPGRYDPRRLADDVTAASYGWEFAARHAQFLGWNEPPPRLKKGICSARATGPRRAYSQLPITDQPFGSTIASTRSTFGRALLDFLLLNPIEEWESASAPETT